MTTVSLAAQISTIPFTIYYFNQFTSYFWLSNLLMTPLSFAVILSGMSLLVFSWVPGLNVFLGKVVWYGLHWMNTVAEGVEWLPLSLVKGLYVDGFQFGISLVLLVLLLLFVNLRKKRMLMEMLVVSAVFALSLAGGSQHLSSQSDVVVYSLRNHTAIAVIQGFNSLLLCDEGLLEEPSSIDYSVKGHWASAQLPMNPPCFTLDEDFRCDLAVKRKRLLSAQGILLAFWDPSDAVGGHAIPVDYLLVRGKQKPDLRSVLGSYQIGTLLIDGSVPDYRAKEWMQQASAHHIPYRDLHDGAVSLNLKY
jgi:competence protein ComEC